MLPIKHILFPIDFSTQGQMVVPYVKAFAGKFGAKVTLLSVVPPIWTPPPRGASPDLDVKAATLELEFKSRLDETMVDEFADLAVERVVRSGDPAEEIAGFARANAVDLIMLPTHGYGMFRGLLIGSVAAKVLHHAEVAVWTSTHAEKQESRHFPKRVLCAVDGGARTSEVMKWAAEFSFNCGARLEFLHVVPRVSDWLALPGERALQQQTMREACERIGAIRNEARLNVPLRVEAGEVANTVADEARRQEADLVVIGRGAISTTQGRLRTHAYGIIHSSPCPVLSI